MSTKTSEQRAQERYRFDNSIAKEKALVYISSTSRERIAMKRFGLFHLDEEPNATIVFGTAFTEDDIEDALRKIGIGGSDLQRDLMYHLRNSQ